MGNWEKYFFEYLSSGTRWSNMIFKKFLSVSTTFLPKPQADPLRIISALKSNYSPLNVKNIHIHNSIMSIIVHNLIKFSTKF